MNIKMTKVAFMEETQDKGRALESRENAVKDFVENRLNKGPGFQSPIKHQKLTFLTMHKLPRNEVPVASLMKQTDTSFVNL